MDCESGDPSAAAAAAAAAASGRIICWTRRKEIFIVRSLVWEVESLISELLIGVSCVAVVVVVVPSQDRKKEWKKKEREKKKTFFFIFLLCCWGAREAAGVQVTIVPDYSSWEEDGGTGQAVRDVLPKHITLLGAAAAAVAAACVLV